MPDDSLQWKAIDSSTFFCNEEKMYSSYICYFKIKDFKGDNVLIWKCAS